MLQIEKGVELEKARYTVACMVQAHKFQCEIMSLTESKATEHDAQSLTSINQPITSAKTILIVGSPRIS